MSSASDSDRPRRRGPVGLDPAQQAELLAFFALGPDDARVLRDYHDTAEASVDSVVAEFYAHLLAFPDLERLLRAEPDRIDRLKELQRAYFLSLTDGRFDADYFESRLRVGDAHQHVGLRPEWYAGAFALYLRLALRRLVAGAGEGARLLPVVEALVKEIFLDVALAMRTYIYGGFVTRETAAELERAARVAEEALHARAEVERLKEDLTGMVVHDLKNPVNGIEMMVRLALRKGSDLPEAHLGHLRQIERTCREMMRLIENLLEIAKIEEGKMPVGREPIVLAELADDVAAEYTPVAEQTGRRIEVAVATDLPPAAADRQLLKRVLVNLVVNAVRHSGSPDVRLEGARGPTPGEVLLRVIDHGRGIPAAEQGHVFEKFRTARRSPTDDPSGDTGLGLPFCKLALEHMGGRIALRSTPARETVFTITLPTYGSP